MNSTEKMEMQVDEEQDGSAVVVLSDSDKSLLPEFNEEESQGKPESEYRADDDSDDNETSEEREALRETRREERRLKKQIHREKTKEATHLISSLKKRNDELAERLAIIEKKTSGAELARVDKAIEDAGVQVEYAKMKMQEAVSSSDGIALTRAQEMWFEAKRKMESLESVKNQATRQMSQPRQNITVPDPMVQKLASDWMERNTWYDPHGRNEESEIAMMIDKKLTAEGFDPSSEDYWDELDDRVAKFIPQKSNRGYNDSNRKERPRSVVTSSGRESTGSARGNEFRLSPDRVAAMKEAGMWDNPELKQKAIRKYAEWDKTNKQRG
jgi:hypothetical protein